MLACVVCVLITGIVPAVGAVTELPAEGVATFADLGIDDVELPLSDGVAEFEILQNTRVANETDKSYFLHVEYEIVSTAASSGLMYLSTAVNGHTNTQLEIELSPSGVIVEGLDLEDGYTSADYAHGTFTAVALNYLRTASKTAAPSKLTFRTEYYEGALVQRVRVLSGSSYIEVRDAYENPVGLQIGQPSAREVDGDTYEVDIPVTVTISPASDAESATILVVSLSEDVVPRAEPTRLGVSNGRGDSVVRVRVRSPSPQFELGLVVSTESGTADEVVPISAPRPGLANANLRLLSMLVGSALLIGLPAHLLIRRISRPKHPSGLSPP
jgi:hypothetical protein